MWNVRGDGSDFDPNRGYANDSDAFTLELHHGGEFVDFPEVAYNGGKITYIDNVSSDLFSGIIMNDMLLELGYSEHDQNNVRYQFKVPGDDLELGLRPLSSDADVLRMLKYVSTSKVLEVYVENVGIISQTDLNDTGVITQVDPTQVDDEGGDQGSDKVGDDSGDEGSDEGGDHGSDEGSDSEDPDFFPTKEQLRDLEDSDCIVDEDNRDDDIDVNMDQPNSVLDLFAGNNVEDNANSEEEIDDLDLDDFDSLSDDDNTTNDKAVRAVRKRKKKGQPIGECPFYVGQAFASKDQIKVMVKEYAVKTRRQLFIRRNEASRFRVICHGINPNMSEVEKGIYKDKVVNKETAKGKSIFPVNKEGRCGVRSKSKGDEPQSKGQTSQKKHSRPTCPWTLHTSNLKKDGTWTVKTLVNEHTCIRTRDVNLCTVSWIAGKIEPVIRCNPEIPIRSLQDIMQKKHQVQVTGNQIFRAKAKATARVHGDYVAQYGSLREYCGELIRSNPGTTVKIEVEDVHPDSPTRQFKRVYICLGPLKRGFKLAGRDLLGLDGCFLKGPFPGQILTAVGVDANNGIYPVAYAVVEAETIASWTWFLECLGDDLDLASNNNFTFISDRQKGIIPAIAKVFSSAEHRYCVRHIHENMKPRWKGEVFKNLLWNAASATTPIKHERAMNAIMLQDKALHEYLKSVSSKHWSRAFFSERPKCDILLNNLCEVFNRQLVQGRDKPIITCLEFIREYCMKRIMIVHKMIVKCNGPLTPNATTLLGKIKTDASQYSVFWCGPGKYQVSGPENEVRAVNIGERSCGCRRWNLTGMPCRHAVACIWNMGLHQVGDGVPEKYVDKAYWLATWKKVYAHTIEPINGADMWEPS